MDSSSRFVRRRPPGIEAIINNKLMWGVFQSMSKIKYAGDEDNPRELPIVTLHDLKKRLILQQKTLTEQWHVPDAMYFVFANDRYSWKVREAITLPKDHFWWIIDNGDTVLLSDTVTHHYTGIFRVDRDNDRVYFSEQWPERFFLRKGMNTKGIEADDALSVSRDEFLKVIVGVVTLGVPNLLEQYLRIFPNQKKNHDFLRRCGLMLLDDDRDRFAQDAAIYLTKALKTAKKSASEAEKKAIASEAYLSLKITYYLQKNEPLAVKPYLEHLHELIETYGRDNLHMQLGAEDIGRIAYSAGNAKEFDDADELFSEAIKKEPDHEYNHISYASVCLHIYDYKRAIKYSSLSQNLNFINHKKIQALLKATDSRNYLGIEHLKGRLLDLDQKFVDSLVIRCNAYLLNKQYDKANLDADTIIQKQGDNPLGYILKTKATKYMGDLDTALWAIEKAASLEGDISKLNFYLMEQEELKRKKSGK